MHVENEVNTMHSTNELRRCDILIAEDDPDSALLLKHVLNQAGFITHVAHTGAEVLSLAPVLRPALILMDWWMPKVDGLECTRQIKGPLGMPDTVILGLTASCVGGERDQMLAAGCDGYLSKPLSITNLVDEVRRRLSARHR